MSKAAQAAMSSDAEQELVSQMSLSEALKAEQDALQDASHLGEAARARAEEEVSNHDQKLRSEEGHRHSEREDENKKKKLAGAKESQQNPGKESQGQLGKAKGQKDGFELSQLAKLAAVKASLGQLEATKGPALKAPAPRPGKGDDALTAMNNAREPGVFFRERGRGPGHGGPVEEIDPELLRAVEEAIRLLANVKGIRRVGPGENEAKEPAVIISAERGFTQASLRAIPETVGRFQTILAIPYELVPLRRERP